MASWWMEGFLDRLLDYNDAIARHLREKATFHIVPHMNPDGAIRGHLRCNAAGANLNREWAEPSQSGVPKSIIPARRWTPPVWISVSMFTVTRSCLIISQWCRRHPRLRDQSPSRALRDFAAAYERGNPDLQRAWLCGVSTWNRESHHVCTNAVAHRFQCPPIHLRCHLRTTPMRLIPYSDGSPERSAQLGASGLDALMRWLKRSKVSPSKNSIIFILSGATWYRTTLSLILTAASASVRTFSRACHRMEDQLAYTHSRVKLDGCAT